ncbi:MAG: T9SS type A sorting domain-containing protein [Saprospiraceae bacterium]|nr:T9SS type A sorting domain-containing protein [Saprospiraceae bacterium]
MQNFFIRIFSTLLLLSIISSCNKKVEINSIPHDSFQWDKYAYPSEENIKHQIKLLQQVKRQAQLRSPSNPFDFEMIEHGPGNIGGRISALAVHPVNVNIIYAGFSVGGLYKTVDGGISWVPIFDNELTNSIGSIAIDPVNPEILYVGTGDPDINGNSYIGNGMYKSTNGGASWTQIGLSEVRIINEILFDPVNSRTLYVGAMGNPFEPSAHRGVYKSTDAGQTWTKILFIADNAGVTDMDIDPTNPKIIYAASFQRVRTTTQSIAQGPLSKIYKSIDGGLNWNIAMEGITVTEFSRISIALAPSSPNIIYARCVRNDKICSATAAYNMEGLYKSTDGASNWTKVNVGTELECDYMGGFGWYFGHIAVHPKNPNEIYLMGVYTFFSKNGGLNWEFLDSNTPETNIHVDHHIMIFDRNSNILLGTDGGLYKMNSATQQWTDIENIATTQFYRLAYNPNEPNKYYGGAQDNGTCAGNKGLFNEWERIFGGDGFQTAFHSKYPDYIWCEYQNGNLHKFDTSRFEFVRFKKGITGTSNWDTPYFISKHNEDTMYFGSNKIFVNASPHIDDWKEFSPDLTTAGPFPNLGTPTISCIAESPLVPGLLISGTTNGNLWIRNPKTEVWTKVNSNLPNGYVTSVRASESDPNTFYVSFSNYRRNDFTAYLFVTRNGGTDWNSIASGVLNEQPINDFIVLPKMQDKVIFTASLTGVYGTLDAGVNWHRVGNNIPYIPVNSILYNPILKEIAVGTFSRSLWSFNASTITATKNTKLSSEIQINNPVQSILKIENIDITFNKVNIINQNGEVLFSKNIYNNSEVEIDVSGLASSIYFLQIFGDNNYKTLKFVKI